jgi:hypothetical protein
MRSSRLTSPQQIPNLESTNQLCCGDLEDRLIDFSSNVIKLVEALPLTKSASYIAKQVIRCGVAPSLLYGEAQSAESRDDFVHSFERIKGNENFVKAYFKKWYGGKY